MTQPESKERLVAFAGSGKATPANVQSLLDNWLTTSKNLKDGEPQYTEIKDFYVPDKILQRKQPGLSNVVAYLTKFWGDEDEDAFRTAPLSDFVSILSQSAGDDAEPFLIIIAGDEGADDETADLVEAALEADITVLDLAAGLDNVTADEDAPAEEAPAEPESPAEAPKRRRRVTAPPDATEAPGAAEATTAPRAKRRGTPRTTAENETRATATLDDLAEVTGKKHKNDDIVGCFGASSNDPPFEPPYKGAEKDTTDAVNAVFETVDEGARRALEGISESVVRKVIVAALRGALAALEAPVDEQLPPAHANEPTTAYIEGEDGELRKRGRGKPKTGEEVIYLTPAEEKKRGLK